MLISFSLIEKEFSEINVYLDYIFMFLTLHYQQLHNELRNGFTACYTVGNSRNQLHFFILKTVSTSYWQDKPTSYFINIYIDINSYHHQFVLLTKKFSATQYNLLSM